MFAFNKLGFWFISFVLQEMVVHVEALNELFCFCFFSTSLKDNSSNQNTHASCVYYVIYYKMHLALEVYSDMRHFYVMYIFIWVMLWNFDKWIRKVGMVLWDAFNMSYCGTLYYKWYSIDKIDTLIYRVFNLHIHVTL